MITLPTNPERNSIRTALNSRVKMAARRFAGAAALLAPLLLLCGCQGPLQVQKQASPNPFVGARQFVLQPTTFTNLQVGGIKETTYLERKNERQQQSWQADQEALAKIFAERLTKDVSGAKIAFANEAPFTITPWVTRIEPGSYVYPAEVDMSVCILDGTGNVLDEVAIVRQVPFDLLASASSGQRIRIAAKLIGSDFGKYLRKRTKK